MTTAPPVVPELEASNRMTLWATVGLALLIRLLLLLLRGDYIVFDEGYYLLLARSLRAGEGFALNGLPHVALSPLQPVVVAGLSFIGVPDIWASRLLAAVCGALLVVPVASLAARSFGERGARIAGVFIAAHPALLTFLPFFPGQGWNLYFGSEPLYLLLATSALACGARAVAGEEWRWWLITGVLAALAWLTRLEGLVLAGTLGLAMLATLAWRRRLSLWPRALAAGALGLLVTAPYLAYLHGALGRWALSGRVQAAAPPAAAARAADSSGSRAAARGGSDAVNDFVWGGDTEALWRTLYALDASGTRMASQYWGIDRTAHQVQLVAAPAEPPRQVPRADPPRRSKFLTLLRAVLVVLPWWLIGLAAWGLARVWPTQHALLWLAPMVLASLIPALLAYAEPRVLLMLVPACAVLAAGACLHLRALLERRLPQGAVLIPAIVTALLLAPTIRAAAGSWRQDTPLQQVSAARRAVGERLAERLPRDAILVSWHPAAALWAGRAWRVLPYDSFDRIMGYARAQHAAAVVFSRFDPSPLRDPPRAFTAILLDSAAAPAGNDIRLDVVDTTAVLFIGRLAGGAPAGPPVAPRRRE